MFSITIDSNNYIAEFCIGGMLNNGINISHLYNDNINLDFISAYKYENDMLVFDESKVSNIILENSKNDLRNKRIPLLLAFDIWEKAVLRNREVDDASIMAWRVSILNLDENSINLPPSRILYYI